MAKLSFLNQAPPLQEDVKAYDEGQAQAIEPVVAPKVDVQSIPLQNQPQTQQPTGISPGEDEKYGFIEQDVFDKPDILTGYEQPVGYESIDAFTEAQAQRNNNFDLLGIGQHHDETVRIAARDSELEDRDYSWMGMAWRSIVAGVGSQIFSAAGDVIDWADSVSDWASGKKDTGKSIFDAEAYKEAPPAFRGESPLDYMSPAMIAGQYGMTNHLAEYFLGIDITKSFTDGLRAIGAALELVDDGVEEQFKNEHGGQFIVLNEDGSPQVDYGQLLVPDFWFTKVAKQIPNIALFYFGGAGAANMSVKGYQALNAAKLVAA